MALIYKYCEIRILLNYAMKLLTHHGPAFQSKIRWNKSKRIRMLHNIMQQFFATQTHEFVSYGLDHQLNQCIICTKSIEHKKQYF